MQTKTVKIGNIFIGGKNKIKIQSMLSVPSDNVCDNIKQARILQDAGCEILRVSIPDKNALSLIGAIKENTNMPLVADIHFDYKLALESISAGIDKIRINPGNIGDEDRIKQVADACRLNNIPIRIGVNGGSLEKHLLAKYQHPTAEALVESALYNAKLLEKYDFENIVISMKSSDVKTTIEAYRLLSQQVSYPLHLGVTETGTERMGIIKSAIGIGSLLADGIGDTFRVSLTADPVREIETAKGILASLGLDDNAPGLISCPTCGRTRIDIIKYANAVDEKLKTVNKPIKVAVMGCVVNGPGEAKEADVGIAGGDGCAVLFKKGEIVRKIDESEILPELFKEIDVLCKEQTKMYRTIIEFEKEISREELTKLTEIINKAFDNADGCLKNQSSEPFTFIFGGNANCQNCMLLANINLKNILIHNKYIKAWKWEDEDPEECSDILADFSQKINY